MRRRRPPKRVILPDPKYKDLVVAKFINGLLYDGKKSVAETLFYAAMDIIEDKMKKSPIDVFKKAMENVAPLLEVKSRRVGGATYQVPVEVRDTRKQALAIRWLIRYSRLRSEKTMAERLAAEFMAAYKNEGTSVKKREDTHKMAEANKAFAHFRW
ncbi:MAG: 30S ribosomal protein S7 [Calditrichae bacterium]|nr:30S ribosomal protein S7 [Calditrichota bacterium]MCB9059639.1 30S ribosomal protein S7 [Calditrichia bacterium]